MVRITSAFRFFANRKKGLFVCLLLLPLVCLGQKLGETAQQTTKTNIHLFRIIQNQKFGFIDRLGKVVIEPRYDEAQGFSEGLALVTLSGRKVFIDSFGKVLLEPKGFDATNGFTDGLARGGVTTRSPYTSGYIDKTGKIVVDDAKMWGACMFSEGLACVVTGKWGFIDTAGRFVIEAKFDEVSPFSEGLAGVTFWDHSKAAHHKHGFIDRSGNVVIKPDFDITQKFSEGLAAVGLRKGNDYQFGFIDKAGSMVIKPQFEWTYFFKEGFAAVKVAGKWGYIDKKGNILIEPQFDKAEEFSEGWAAVAINGKWGFIDKKGKFVIQPRFNDANSFSDGLAFVKIGGDDANAIIDVIGDFDRKGKWGYVDKTGKYVWEPTN